MYNLVKTSYSIDNQEHEAIKILKILNKNINFSFLHLLIC